ncbi:F-box domain containing protein [Quillaja saponaria]|uniref:F-box domain containing protein n=1 Tax=Quillaja saponaria TaxID=32244 RepID=A0AAD7QC84_QUISA|nr:F-box domain containing protein [Quillaja saponaria]
MDDHHQNSSTKAIGLCLLPSELMQNIFLSLVLPEIVRLKLVNKSFSNIISDQNFIRECNLKSKSTTWLFVYKKRWLRDATLHGFTDQSDRWFRIPIIDFLKPINFHGEDLYFLTASGNVFLFASNNVQEVIAVNFVTVTVKIIPPSPLGPRGTSSWRRSGMKLIPGKLGSDHFRFLFAEFIANRPVLFVYESESNKWELMEAEENVDFLPRGSQRGDEYIFLSVVNGARESVLIATEYNCNSPLILRPRFDVRGQDERPLTVGFSWGNTIDRLHVYGDGYMMIVKSDGADPPNRNLRMIKEIEVWGLSLNGRNWEYMSSVPNVLIEKIKKPYGVMMGCLEERNGTLRAAMMSNFEGLWDIVWLTFDVKAKEWSWVPLPDCKMKGFNMAGISFSSGLALP